MIALLTHEKASLAFFIEQSKTVQTEIFIKAKQDNRVSGCLIMAYKLVLENIK